MSRESSWSSSLLNAAQSRGIKIDAILDDLSQDDYAPDVAEWIDQNLVKLKPLTSEELALVRYIEKSKFRAREPVAQDAVTSVPLDEEGLQDVIHNLQCSTESLRGRSRTLKDQIKIATNLGGFDNPNDQLVMPIEARFERQQDAEKQQMLFVNHEIQMDLLEKLQQTQQKLDKCFKTVTSTVKERFKADDRILDVIAAPTTPVISEGLVLEPNGRLLLAALQRTVVSRLKTDLDHVYLRELTALDDHPDEHVDPNELEQTQGDLQSLYSEIEDVASMLVETEFGTSIRLMAEQYRRTADDVAARRAVQLTQNLEALIQSTEQLSIPYQHLQAYRIMCKEIEQVCLRVKAQDQPGALRSLHEETANGDEEISALLRHLSIGGVELANHKNLARQAQSASLSIADESRLSVLHMLESIQNSATRSRGCLRYFSSISNDDLSEALLHNKELDNRMISAKTRLEQTYGTSSTSAGARRRFADGS